MLCLFELARDTLNIILVLCRRGSAIHFPLVLITIWMDFYPMPFLDRMDASVTHLIEQVNAARAAHEAGVLTLGAAL